MAEAIAVIGAVASIVQIINIVTKSINRLSNIRSQWKDADLTCLSLAAQLTTMRAALTKIHEWIDDSLGTAHHQLVMDLDVSISCCNLLIMKIDSLLPDLTELTKSEPDFPKKMKVLFESPNIDEAQKLIERQTSALGLLLSACSCKTIAEQKTLLEKSKSRKQLHRIQSDSASLWVHRDTDTLRSRFTDNLSRISMVFPFDKIVFSSNVYERVFRGSLKESLRRQQNGPLSETRKRQRDGKDTAAFIDFLGKEERPPPILGPGIEVGLRPPAKNTNYASPMLQIRKAQDHKIMLMSSDEHSTSWLLEMLERHIAHSLTSQLIINRTIVHCGNVLISAMKKFAIRPEKRSNDNNYTFLTEHHPYQSLDARFIGAMLSIWQDPCICTVLERSAGLPSMDIVPHFLDTLATRVYSGHVPRDVQECKSDRPGIYETHISRVSKYDSLTTHHFVGMEFTPDLLGYVVRDCETILMIINLSRYHQIEDNQRPRIMNDLDLFKSAKISGSLKHMARVLLFVRPATFKQDLATHPLEVYFPDYSGQQAEKFISAQFLKIKNKSILGPEYTYSLWTCPESVGAIGGLCSVLIEAQRCKSLQLSGIL